MALEYKLFFGAGIFQMSECMMIQHIKALFAVIFIGLISVWGFNTFFINKIQDAPQTIQTLDAMKLNGVPNFSLLTINGEKFELEQLKGKVIILNFWASWCGPCVQEVPSLIKLVQHFKGEVQVLAISADSSTDDLTAFLKSFPEMNGEYFKVIHDQDRSKMKMFDVTKLPESLILDKNQKLVKKISGSIDWANKDSFEYMNSLLN
jgi:thiol-disulfide isomerase/thioredoxin